MSLSHLHGDKSPLLLGSLAKQVFNLELSMLNLLLFFGNTQLNFLILSQISFLKKFIEVLFYVCKY